MATSSTELMPKDELIREATVEDYQAVLDINPGAYEGCDYLPAMFTSKVKGCGVKGYVYLKDTKVIGFLSIKAVDGGQSLVASAGRIHPDHRGGGKYGRLHREVLKRFVTSLSPKAPRRELCTVDNLNMNNLRQRLMDNFNVVLEKKVTCAHMEVDQTRQELSSGPDRSTSHLQPLTHHHLHSILSQPPAHLFPQQHILLHWDPIRAMAENADVIMKSGRDPVFVTGELASIGKGNNFPVPLLSCGSHYPSQRGEIYNVDVFGSGSDQEVRAHLVWHLRRLTEVATEKSAIMIIFADRHVEDAVTMLQPEFSVNCIVFPFHTAFILEAALKH